MRGAELEVTKCSKMATCRSGGGVLLMLATVATLCYCKQPNIVFLLTDDQDLMLGGTTPMSYTRQFMSTHGAQLNNFFVNTPVCCPSRTTLLSGKYPHNWHVTHGGCMSMNVTNPVFQQSTIGVHMQKLGYVTGMFGKFLNPEGMSPYCEDSQLLPGFDDFLAMCDDNRYFENKLNSNGLIYTTGTDPEDYLTSVIGNTTLKFVESALSGEKPFFAYIAPHAPHVPATPAPWYADEFTGLMAPRTLSYNQSARDHHYVVRSQDPLNSTVGMEVDQLFENRWRTLLSVDDIMKTLLPLLEAHGQLNNTYIIQTSDHGFQLGQFRLPSCKLQPYEHDIRVPFFVHGPEIQAGYNYAFVAGMVDVAPTLLTLGGGVPLDTMDGKSFAELLFKPITTQSIREKHMLEYWTLGNVIRYGHYIDMPNNTFIGVRLLNSTHNYMYAEFYEGKGADFDVALEYELYNVAKDPYQMINLYGTVDEDKQLVAELHQYIHTEVKCSGQSNCR